MHNFWLAAADIGLAWVGSLAVVMAITFGAIWLDDEDRDFLFLAIATAVVATLCFAGVSVIHGV